MQERNRRFEIISRQQSVPDLWSYFLKAQKKEMLSSNRTDECRCHFLPEEISVVAKQTITDETYDCKMDCILSKWHVLSHHRKLYSTVCIGYINLLFRYTVNLVVNPRWDPDSAESVGLQRAISAIISKPLPPLPRMKCIQLKDLASNPWQNPILLAITNGSLAKVDREKVAAYFNYEDKIILWARLEQLCESPEVLGTGTQNEVSPALLFVMEWENHLRQTGLFQLEKPIHVFGTGSPFNVRDAMLALLVRDGRLDILEHYMFEYMHPIHIKNMRERTGIWERYLPAHLAEQASEVNKLSCKIVAEKVMQVDTDWDTCYLTSRIQWSLILQGECPERMVRYLAELASCPEKIFFLCRKLPKHLFGDRYIAICIELYIKGLSKQMEQTVIYTKDRDGRKRQQRVNKMLSSVFEDIAVLFSDLFIKREMLLTAFTLNPSERLFVSLCDSAHLTGKACYKPGCAVAFTSSWCKKTPPHTLCVKCGKFGQHVKPQNSKGGEVGSLAWHQPLRFPSRYDVMDLPPCHIIDDAPLSIPEELLEHLVGFVSAYRDKTFSWTLDWAQLYSKLKEHRGSSIAACKADQELLFKDIEHPLYTCLVESGKIVPVTFHVRKKCQLRRCIKITQMNTNNYIFYKRLFSSVNKFFLQEHIQPGSEEMCDLLEIDTTIGAHEKLYNYYKKILKLYENLPLRPCISKKTAILRKLINKVLCRLRNLKGKR